MRAAAIEIVEILKYQEWESLIEHAPVLMISGWLEDHGFPLQSKAALEWDHVPVVER